MSLSRAISPIQLCARAAVLAMLALLAIGMSAAPSVAAAAPASPAVLAARAQGTPPIVTPPKRRRTVFTCTFKGRRTRCARATKYVCAAAKGAKTCIKRKVVCSRSGRLKHCTTTRRTCVHRAGAKTRCSVFTKRTLSLTEAVHALQAIPRFVFQQTTAAAGIARDQARAAHGPAITLVSSTNGGAAAPPPVPVATSRTSTGMVGAGIGALVLAFALMSLLRGPWRRRGS